MAEWFIAISLKLILVKSTNIRSNRIFSDENTILLQQPSKAKKQLLLSKYLNTTMASKNYKHYVSNVFLYTKRITG